MTVQEIDNAVPTLLCGPTHKEIHSWIVSKNTKNWWNEQQEVYWELFHLTCDYVKFSFIIGWDFVIMLS